MLTDHWSRVWKVGASLLGLLTPAGPPPQGHGSHSNEAYKTLEFKLASPEEGESHLMSLPYLYYDADLFVCIYLCSLFGYTSHDDCRSSIGMAKRGVARGETRQDKYKGDCFNIFCSINNVYYLYSLSRTLAVWDHVIRRSQCTATV